MPKYLVKTNRDEDFYVYWSEITDSPYFWGTRDEVSVYDEINDERIERADKTGTSAFDSRFGGWNDEGWVYEQIGWLPRQNLKSLCLWLDEHGEDTDVSQFLEPLEDDE